MSEIVDPHVVKPGLLLDPPPVPGKAGQAGTGLAPRSTQGTPSARSMPSSTFRTGPVSGTMRGPVFESRNRSTRAVRSTSSHFRLRISSDRHPVSISRRIAATAEGIIEPSVSSLVSAAPRYRYSSGVRNRSRDVPRYWRTWRVGLRPGGTIPQFSARVNILESTHIA